VAHEKADDNLAPADVRKEGTGWILAIAVALLPRRSRSASPR
jgi:predicted ATPase with chaperone activity